MNSLQEIFFNSFVKGSGKTFGVVLVLGLTWQLYKYTEQRTKFIYSKVPKDPKDPKEILNDAIDLAFKGVLSSAEKERSFSTDIEQIDNENEIERSFDFKSLFDKLR